MLKDGNLLVFDEHQDPRVAVWSTGTASVNEMQFAQLVVQDDGNLVLYKTDKPNCESTTAVWASNTNNGNRHRLVLQNNGALCVVNADCTRDDCESDWCSPTWKMLPWKMLENAVDNDYLTLFEATQSKWYYCPENLVLGGFHRSMHVIYLKTFLSNLLTFSVENVRQVTVKT